MTKQMHSSKETIYYIITNQNSELIIQLTVPLIFKRALDLALFINWNDISWSPKSI